MSDILTRIAEAKDAWQRLHPEKNPFIVALGERAALELKRESPEAKDYDPSTITLSARVLGLHVEEDFELQDNAIEVR